MNWDSYSDWWWPLLFILLAGALPTYLFRVMGVIVGGRVREDSEVLVFVRCVATALVAGVIAQLILYPNGELANSPCGCVSARQRRALLLISLQESVCLLAS